MKLDMEQNPAVCGKYISLIYRKSAECLTRILKEIGLSSMQSILLVGIFRNPGINQRRLAAIVSIDPAAASRTLRSLELDGMLRKEIDEENRRNFKLYLTKAGNAKVEESLLLQEAYWKNVLRTFTSEQIQCMNEGLRLIQCNVYEDAPEEER